LPLFCSASKWTLIGMLAGVGGLVTGTAGGASATSSMPLFWLPWTQSWTMVVTLTTMNDPFFN
jgi:hypothetical protein